MKLWIDDLRVPPTDWQWAKSSEQAIRMLTMYDDKGQHYNTISFDHDLGGDDTTRPVMLWLCEHEAAWPDRLSVHTANPVGRQWLEGMAKRYAPGQTAVG